MTELLNLTQTAELLNFSDEEIMELVRQKRIPHLYFLKGDKYIFPKEEVLRTITPRPKKEEKPSDPEIITETETQGPVVARRGRPKKQT